MLVFIIQLLLISNDVTVRKYIKNSTLNELKILGKFAQSQMIDNMKDKVLRMTKKYSEKFINKVTQKQWKRRKI